MPTQACRASVSAVALALALALGGVTHALAGPPGDLAPPGLEQAEIPVIGETTEAAIHAPDEIVRNVEDTTGVRVPDVTGVAEGPGGSPVSATPAVPADPTPGPEGKGAGPPPALPDGATRSPGFDATSPARTGSSAGGQTGPRAQGVGDGARGARPSSVDPRERSNPSDDGEPTGASAILNAFSELPWSVFAAMLAIAVLGVAMAARSGLLSRTARLLRRQRGELRDDVGALQSALLPDLPERIGPVGISVAYRPAEGPAAGGDFHDVLELGGGRIGVIVGDVCGHGREALPMTGLVHYTLRAYLEAGLEPRETLRLADAALGSKLRNQFATAVVAVYDPSESVLVYALAGHPAPIVTGAGADHAIEALTPPPIGVGAGAGYRQTQVAIGEGERVWFVSDGLTEARNETGSMLGREDLTTWLAPSYELPSATEALAGLSAETTTADDMTACVLSPIGAEGDAVVMEEVDLDPSLELEQVDELLAACGVTPGETLRVRKEIERCDPRVAPVRLRVRRDPTSVRWNVASLADPGQAAVHELARRPAADPPKRSSLAAV